ncbi:MAG: hypothetical protein ABI723_24285 [Bacteroidia bacterium]
MKSIKSWTITMFALVLTLSATAKSDWKELKDFHSVMSKSFHPSEEGNLQPVKDMAADLVAKAKAWKASEVPADYNKELTTETLTKLLSKCEEVQAAVVAKKSDEDLKKLISEAHDIFHRIVEKCRIPEKDEEKK